MFTVAISMSNGIISTISTTGARQQETGYREQSKADSLPAAAAWNRQQAIGNRPQQTLKGREHAMTLRRAAKQEQLAISNWQLAKARPKTRKRAARKQGTRHGGLAAQNRGPATAGLRQGIGR